MRDDIRNDNLEERDNSEDNQLRPNTMNEQIRAAHGDPDTDLNELGDHSTGADPAGASRSAGAVGGVNYAPNDASGTLSGGISDMDNQGGVGGHAAPGSHGKFGSNLEPKHNVTGSDFDGQVSTS